MRRDKTVRIIALICLCALVYYFSFDQGRIAQGPKMERLEKTIEAKERVIESMAAEIKSLKEQLENARTERTDPAKAENGEESLKLTLRLQNSRLLFDERVVLSCLEIDRKNKEAKIQLNLVKEDVLITKTVGLGRSLIFELDKARYSLIVDQIHSSFISVVVASL